MKYGKENEEQKKFSKQNQIDIYLPKFLLGEDGEQ